MLLEIPWLTQNDKSNYPSYGEIINGGKDVKAIIKTGGKQYTVSEGDVITVEKLVVAEGDSVEFAEVLAIIDGDKLKVGKPLIKGAKVTAKVLAQGKDRKIIVFKYKPKKSYQKKQGHRQCFTKVQIEKIEVSE